jgi:hypothetical protein
MTGFSKRKSEKIGLLRLPQRIAVEAEISQQRDGDRLTFINGSVSVGRRLNSPAPKVGKAWALL